MSIATFILGESGTGKTTSLRNLDPAKTLLIQAVRKPLPFRSKGWAVRTKEGKGNIYQTDNAVNIVTAMQKASFDVIVIDDFQYILANEYMRRTGETGYQKFTDIGRSAWDILMAASALEDHKRVYILAHTDTNEQGRIKAKSIGKMLDEKITMEGLLTVVLRTLVRDGEFYFSTKNSGNDTVKSPIGLFDDEFIPNDLALVDKAITDFYNQTEQE